MFDLFSQPEVPHMQGYTYDPAKDHARLSKQLLRVRDIMQDGGWHTLKELAEKVGGSEAGVSARIRDLRKAAFGAHKVTSRRVAGGLWHYRMELTEQ